MILRTLRDVCTIRESVWRGMIILWKSRTGRRSWTEETIGLCSKIGPITWREDRRLKIILFKTWNLILMIRNNTLRSGPLLVKNFGLKNRQKDRPTPIYLITPQPSSRERLSKQFKLDINNTYSFLKFGKKVWKIIFKPHFWM